MIPRDNIEWTRVRKTDRVVLVGATDRCYVVNGSAVACWSGTDAVRAQRYLDVLVKKTQAKS